MTAELFVLNCPFARKVSALLTCTWVHVMLRLSLGAGVRRLIISWNGNTATDPTTVEKRNGPQPFAAPNAFQRTGTT